MQAHGLRLPILAGGFLLFLLAGGVCLPAHAGSLASEVATIKNSDKPVIVYIFASWCPHCRKTFPDMIALAQEEQEKFQPIFISTDKDLEALKKYLKTLPQLPNKVDWAYDKKNTLPLDQFLKKYRMSYDGIPYFGVLVDGKLAQQFSGGVSKDELRKLIHQAYKIAKK